MKRKDKEAFLKSIKGVSPITKNNKLEKPTPQKNTSQEIKKTKKIISLETSPKIEKKEIKKSFYKIQKNTINKKLKKGKIPIDKKIDFHGMSVFDAEQLFEETIVNCYNNNMRCLLFVTGKGVLKKNENELSGPILYYGKIRNSFFSWANKEKIQKYILSVEQADIKHGADGAFFVYLRKTKF